MKKTITLALCFMTFMAFGQSNFVAGHIIKNNGQLVKGFIDYREWQINPRTILFKDKSNKIAHYSCKDLIEFGMTKENEIYQQAAVAVNYTPPISAEYTDKPIQNRLQLTHDTVFLLTLVKGAINLYSLKDKDNEPHFFIQKGNSPLEELIRQVFYTGNGYSLNALQVASYRQLRYSEDYENQLIELMADYPSIKNDVKNLFFEDNSIAHLVKKYNAYVGKSDYIKPMDKTNSLAFQILGGIAQSNFRAVEFYTGHINTTPTTTYSPTIGVGIEKNISRTNKKAFWGFDASYQQNKVSYSTEPKSIKSNVNIDVNGLKSTAYLKYVLYKGSLIQPYIKGGASFSTYFTRQITSNSELTATPLMNTQKLSKSEFFVFGALGIHARSFFLETRFEPGTDINNTAGQDLKIHRVSLLAGYVFSFGK